MINRAEAIREMLVCEFGIVREHVTAFPSRSNTGGNIAIFAQKIRESGQPQSSFFLMTNLYHLPRAMFDLKAAGLFEVQPIPAETAILFHDPTAKNELVRFLGEGPLAERIVEEAAGIADKLRGTYTPRTDVQPIALSRPQEV